MSNSIPKWDDTREATLKKVVGTTSPVSAVLVNKAAETLGTTDRSVASKLRKMGYEVESMAAVRTKSYTAAQEAEINSFLDANPQKYTYAEIAAAVLGGVKSPKEIQGKILSMDKTSLVKPTPKVEVEKKFSDAEELKLLGLIKKDMFIEDIAASMNREVNSIRGKILSLSRTNPDIKIPKQKTYKSKDAVDPITALGDVSEMTIAEISTATGKTERGVKTMLTHRGLACKDYNGAKKAEKIAAAASASA